MNNANGCASVHASMDQGQDAFVCLCVYECSWGGGRAGEVDSMFQKCLVLSGYAVKKKGKKTLKIKVRGVLELH